MTESIYHLNEQGQIEPMSEKQFDREDTLQKLLADHPELLSGEQMNPDKPRRWVLINREQGIADTEGGNSRWSVDHLLIDQDAILTLVEVKRSSNSEIRRTIVGQMLDYAAHATRTWNVGDIRQSFEESAEDPDIALADLLKEEPDPDEFWRRVETNLRAARLRLLFVADGIPDELTRVVEFLNEQMPGIEVLAVEIKQFLGATGQTLVPRVIGRTAAAPDRTSAGGRRPMDNDEFLNQMPSPEIQHAAKRLLDVANECGAQLTYGNATVSIRCRTSAWRQPVTVAWLSPTPAPYGSSAGNRNFRFGAGNWSPDFFTNLPEGLREVLEKWAGEFENQPGAWDVSAPGHKAWAFTHEDAAKNIDVLAERLDKVLTELTALPMQP